MCLFVDDLNCMNFLFDIPSCIFNQNAWICSYKRLGGSNYYTLNGLKQQFEKVLVINFISTYANLLQRYVFAYFLLIKHHRKVCSMKGASHWSRFQSATFQESYSDNSISSWSNLLKKFIFVQLLLNTNEL